MLLGAVEKERSFPQFRGGFPRPFAEIIGLGVNLWFWVSVSLAT